MKKVKLSFDQFFQEYYQERWDALKTALTLESNQVQRSCFKDNYPLNFDQVLQLPNYQKSDYEQSQIRNSDNLRKIYVMDPASIISALSLEIQPDDKVLDMCAAPGGKTLILLENLKNGELWANEISKNRRERLKKVIQDYVPKQLRENVFIKGKDAIKYGLSHPDHFEKILLDAPCSGEQHLLNSPNELAKWSVKRTQKLAGKQYGLLCSAILACKSQGQIVYSTCSISPLENDGVIEKALKKKSDLIDLDLPQIDIPGIERTEFGYTLLPDKIKAGPIYFSRIRKK